MQAFARYYAVEQHRRRRFFDVLSALARLGRPSDATGAAHVPEINVVDQLTAAITRAINTHEKKRTPRALSATRAFVGPAPAFDAPCERYIQTVTG